MQYIALLIWMQYDFSPSPKREEARKYSPSLLAERGLGGEVPCIATKTEPLYMIVS
jgi:hypothetical protein